MHLFKIYSNFHKKTTNLTTDFLSVFYYLPVYCDGSRVVHLICMTKMICIYVYYFCVLKYV